MKTELVAQIEELERKAAAFDALNERVKGLQGFIDDWDSKDPDRLPVNHRAKIAPVRALVEICKNNNNGDGL